MSDGCVDFVGGVFVVAWETVCATLLGGLPVSMVFHHVGVCCFPYVVLGWRCGAMAAGAALVCGEGLLCPCLKAVACCFVGVEWVGCRVVMAVQVRVFL